MLRSHRLRFNVSIRRLPEIPRKYSSVTRRTTAKSPKRLFKHWNFRGLRCWISSRDVAGGENYQEAIVHAIRNAKIMLLVFTDNANNSDEIKKELVLASRNKLTVIPVRIEDVLPNDALDFELATRQWINFFGDWERALDTLCKRASGILQG